MGVEGNKVVCDCGYVNVVAGLYRRNVNVRTTESRGEVAPEGQYRWGQLDCIGCGKHLTVPSAEESG